VLGAGSHSIVHSFPHRGSTRPSTASVAAGNWQAIRLLQAILISLWRSRFPRMGNAPITTVTTGDKDRDIAKFDAGGAAYIEQQTTGTRQSKPWTPPSPPAFALFCPPHIVMILDCLLLPTIATSGPILLASPCASISPPKRLAFQLQSGPALTSACFLPRCRPGPPDRPP
jgi:hypothetical protein